MNEKQIFITSDSHGDWNGLFKKITNYNINNCILISCGDNAEGFKHPEKERHNFRILNEDFKNRGIHFWAIRGNHSNPAYFYGQYNLSNFRLIKDYTLEQIDGKKFLFAGGAVSFDRQWLTLKKDYWFDEEFVLREDAPSCDVLITHTGPSWIGPGVNAPLIVGAAKTDKTLINDLLEERARLDRLVEISKPTELFCGHFHRKEQNTHNGCNGRIIDILELYNYNTGETL